MRKMVGFTLLELLVVIVIIGLLAGYVAPRYFGQIGKSEVQVARAQLDREERRAKRAFLREARLPVPAGRDAEDGEAAAARDLTRRRFACGVEAERNDLLRAIEGVEVEPHYRLSVTCCARPMSASSPLPPGLPSRPSE